MLLKKCIIFYFNILGVSNLTGLLRIHVCEVMSGEVVTDELNELNEKYANCLLMYFYLLSRISYHLETYSVKKFAFFNIFYLLCMLMKS